MYKLPFSITITCNEPIFKSVSENFLLLHRNLESKKTTKQLILKHISNQAYLYVVPKLLNKETANHGKIIQKPTSSSSLNLYMKIYPFSIIYSYNMPNQNIMKSIFIPHKQHMSTLTWQIQLS